MAEQESSDRLDAQRLETIRKEEGEEGNPSKLRGADPQSVRAAGGAHRRGLLRYVEIGSSLRRGISVLKMRGHQHDKTVCEFEISEEGLRILPGFGSWFSILSGQPQPFQPGFESPMRSLSDLENQVLESLARRGPASVIELSRQLVAHPDEPSEVLENLQRFGFVSVETRSDG